MNFKPTNKMILRLTMVIGILLWVALTFVNGLQVFDEIYEVNMGISQQLPALLLDLFFIAFIIYYRLNINKVESSNFVDLLWRVFAIGLVTTVISLASELFYTTISDTTLANHWLTNTLFYNINFALVSVFLISTFTVWKKLVLYQKSRRLVVYWNTFEGLLMACIFFNFTGLTLQSSVVFQLLFGVLALLALILSANLKWVAYLNFKQKWKSILLILLISIYLIYFFRLIYTPESDSIRFLNSIDNLFIITLFTFLLVYSIFSLLVILFNLPTSSVFEQKLEEAINFQRLSQSIQQGENENQIFDLLLKSTMSAVYADAGWVEIEKLNGEPLLRTKNISRVNLNETKRQIKAGKKKHLLKTPLDKSSDEDRILVNFKKSNFRSALIVPLFIKNKIAGQMYLLKEVSDGFNSEMINIINTFSSQAAISVENFRLLGDALENERYKEELNIAKSVQRALIPKKLDHDEHFEIHAFTEAAAEVGGDYYDTFKLDEHKFAVVIGDVSGNGTSAAFHMSQMKGIFQSLAQLDLSAKEFMIKANSALSKCLEKKSFITLSYFIIDTLEKSIEYSRAGHCPTLYYSKKEGRSKYLETKGLGLGILRNEKYENFVNVNKITFAKDDIVMLYTDGISEATNSEKDEFGYDRLKTLLDQNSHYDPIMIQKIFIGKLYEFCGNEDLNDDYTMVVIKFK